MGYGKSQKHSYLRRDEVQKKITGGSGKDFNNGTIRLKSWDLFGMVSVGRQRLILEIVCIRVRESTLHKYCLRDKICKTFTEYIYEY